MQPVEDNINSEGLTPLGHVGANMAAVPVPVSSSSSPSGEAASLARTSTNTLFRFSPEQKKFLLSYWEEKGMQTCSKELSSVISDCAATVGCSPEQVKVWCLFSLVAW